MHQVLGSSDEHLVLGLPIVQSEFHPLEVALETSSNELRLRQPVLGIVKADSQLFLVVLEFSLGKFQFLSLLLQRASKLLIRWSLLVLFRCALQKEINYRA